MLSLKKSLCRSLLLLGVGAGLIGCTPQNLVDASRLDASIQSVTARHDAYVNADTRLSATEKESDLLQSQQLRGVMDDALRPATPTR